MFIPPAEPPRRYYYYYKQATHHPVYKRDGFRSLVALPQITESCENLNSLVVAGAINIYEHGFLQSLRVLKNLTHLWLTHVEYKQDFRLDVIFAELPSLKDLEIAVRSSSSWTIGRNDCDILPN